MYYCICIMTKWAETECVPPASGVIVSAVEFPAGFITDNNELITWYHLFQEFAMMMNQNRLIIKQ